MDELKKVLMAINDQLVVLQFDFILEPTSPLEQKKYTEALKELQSFIYTLLENLPHLNLTSAAEKISLLQQTANQLRNDWQASKINVSSTAAPSTTRKTNKGLFAKTVFKIP